MTPEPEQLRRLRELGRYSEIEARRLGSADFRKDAAAIEWALERLALLESALRIWGRAYEWVGADSFDGMDPDGRELMDHAHSNGNLALDGFDARAAALADKLGEAGE